MQVLLVEFCIHASFVPAFEAAIAENARASRREPGCRQFDVCRDAADPSLFYLYELYDDEAAIQAHLQSPHFLSMDSATRDWVATKTVRRLTRTNP
ncbi:antibiotic biosynthesis monooxygenase [Ramlibacter ginsenosidimutans]|uniref:Antibiotic biosynthesis monooxygenase n=1 Tax=Ramlibacter ginsenosidimutans TaxID=502333 RepID=A0A934WKX6_9BURK|nr:putative quinol monooxygenase [Ramlibacter ginsenosidimutans]MBK6004818.1 antibiotic biosynthesis monooxygenase [Ramlibacter ginsenosidimutans]